MAPMEPSNFDRIIAVFPLQILAPAILPRMRVWPVLKRNGDRYRGRVLTTLEASAVGDRCEDFLPDYCP
jgi:hypothetical protein